LAIDHGRIGITGLGEVEGTRTPEGTILHGTYEKIREAFLSATVDATPIGRRAIKSARKSVESRWQLSKRVKAEIEAKPGARDWDVRCAVRHDA
jgi:hypothetical protein